MARIVLIVLDSVGVEELPDAKDFGEMGANTLKHVKQNVFLGEMLCDLI